MNTNTQTHKEQDASARQLVGFAWPTGRAVYTYTAAEIAAGVDVYTQFLKRRNTCATGGGGDAA